MLTGGSRAALPRHQTLQAALDWSFQSLSAVEKPVFRRLAVFAGGFTLSAAEAVCAGEDLAAVDVLEPLTRLVRKSLVTTEDRGDDRRYRMLEPMRQYARDKLREAGEIESARGRHLDWFLPLAEEAEPRLRSHGQWLRRLETEHDNLRAALEWALAGDHPEPALRLATALKPLWELHGHFLEGRRRLAEALARDVRAPVPVALQARALAAAASLAQEQHDHNQTETFAAQSLTLYREIGDRRGEAHALRLLGSVARWHSDFSRAAQLFQEALVHFQAEQDEWGIATCARAFGGLARAQKRYEEAATHFTAALHLFRKVGDDQETANTLYFLGLTARAQGEFAQALAYAEEALVLARALEDAYSAAHALHLTGTVAWYQGDYARAAALHEQSLPMFQELGDWNCVATTTTDLGLVAQQQGNLERAVALHQEGLRRRLGLEDQAGVAESLERVASAVAPHRGEEAARFLGAAEALRENLGVPLSPVEKPRYEKLVAALRTALGDATLTAA